MKDHETEKVKILRDQLTAENERLSWELFKRRPLSEKILVYMYCAVLFITIIFVGCAAYKILIAVVQHFFSR